MEEHSSRTWSYSQTMIGLHSVLFIRAPRMNALSQNKWCVVFILSDACLFLCFGCIIENSFILTFIHREPSSSFRFILGKWASMRLTPLCWCWSFSSRLLLLVIPFKQVYQTTMVLFMSNGWTIQQNAEKMSFQSLHQLLPFLILLS